MLSAADDAPFPRDLFAQALGEIGLAQTPAQIETHARFYELLRQWAARINLTGTRDPRELVLKHFADSLLVASVLGGDERLLDLGAGAGFPSLPLAIALPGVRATLVEARAKRAAFLRHAIRTLRLANAEVWDERIERIEPPEGPGPFDAAIQRATFAPTEFLGHARPWLRPGGRALLMQGPGATELSPGVLATLGFETEPPRSFRLPVLGDPRVVRAYRRKD